MVSWKRVAELFRRLEKAGLDPQPEPFTAVRDIDWEGLPPTVDSRTLLKGRRLEVLGPLYADLSQSPPI